MHAVSASFDFCYGHRLLGHAGKCRWLHGHSGRAVVTVVCQKLDRLGMVVDFADLKKLVGGWIDEYWDHNMLLHGDDPLLALYGDERYYKVFGGRRPFEMPKGMNPTAEYMAEVLYGRVGGLLAEYEVMNGRGWLLKGVTIHETDKCSASYEPPW